MHICMCVCVSRAWGARSHNAREPIASASCKATTKALNKPRSPTKMQNQPCRKPDNLLRPALQLDILDLVVALPDTLHHPAIRAPY